MKRSLCLWLGVCLSGPASLWAADAKRPNILFAFADDWGRYAGAYAQTRRPRHDQRRGADAELRSRGPGRGAVPPGVRLRPELHAVPQRPPVGPALLADRSRCHPARRRLGRLPARVPAAAPRCRLSHRRDVQGVEPRHAGRRTVRRGEIRLREGRPAVQPVLGERHEDGRRWDASRGGQAGPVRRGAAELRRLPATARRRTSRSATGSARRTCIASGSRARARRCGASTRIR